MSQAQLFLVGLLAVSLAAVWYDRRVEETRAAAPAHAAAADTTGVAVR